MFIIVVFFQILELPVFQVFQFNVYICLFLATLKTWNIGFTQDRVSDVKSSSAKLRDIFFIYKQFEIIVF